MSETAITSRDQDAAHLSTFPIRSLPQELRDRIYEYALEPRAVFLQTDQDHIHQGYSLPTMSFWGDSDLDPEDYEVEDPSDVDTMTSWDPNFVQDFSRFSPFLAFKLITSTPREPLLLVSKDINKGIRRLLNRYHETIKSAIYFHRIVSPSPLFLDICSRSRFMFNHSSWAALYFLSNLPEYVKPLVRDIVILNFCLEADDMENRQVWTLRNKTHCDFTDVLCDELPNLETIGLVVPGTYEGMEWYCGYAPELLCALLSANRLHIVRFLYLDCPFKVETDENFLERNNGPLNDAPPPESDPIFPIETVSRVYDVVEEMRWKTHADSREWSSLGFKRVVKITRWTDTRLGSATYKGLVFD